MDLLLYCCRPFTLCTLYRIVPRWYRTTEHIMFILCQITLSFIELFCVRQWEMSANDMAFKCDIYHVYQCGRPKRDPMTCSWYTGDCSIVYTCTWFMTLNDSTKQRFLEMIPMLKWCVNELLISFQPFLFCLISLQHSK